MILPDPARPADSVAPERCRARTVLTSDEDGPLPEPIEIFCRLEKGHREMHYNGYASWGASHRRQFDGPEANVQTREEA